MKNVLFVLLLSLALLGLSACTSSNEQTTEATTEAITTETNITETNTTETQTTNNQVNEDEEVLSGFYDLIEAESPNLEILTKYVKVNIVRLSSNAADELIFAYENAQIELLPEIQMDYDSLEMQELYRPYDLTDLRTMNVEHIELKQELEALWGMGLQIEQAEGSFFPVINYGFYQLLTPNASEEVRVYFALMQAESDQPSQKDGGLTIGWTEVLNRASGFEKFMLSYPESDLLPKALMKYDNYRVLALEGSINTSLFDRDSKEMHEEAINEFKAFAESVQSKTERTPFEQMMVDYVQILENNNFIMNEEVTGFVGENR